MTEDEEPRRDEPRRPVHQPVLLEEVVESLRIAPGGLYADLTLGAGGHAVAVLERSAPDGFLLGLDCDAEILIEAQSVLKAFENRIQIEQGNFSKAVEIFESHIGKADGVIMDLGLSSLQLDRAGRGFSIQRDGPLDLRMDQKQKESAQELVNQGLPEDLLFAISRLGEEPKARAIVKAIVEERKKRPILHTSDLRSLVEQVYGRRGGKIHPATRTFQGLRMMVNREPENLALGLEGAFKLCKRGGRMAVISFHSGEDRIVKGFMKERSEGAMVSRKPIRPGVAEVRRNRRSRSARLRIMEKD